MLSVIVTSGDPGRLAGLLAALTAAAVEGLVREVIIAAEAPADLLDALCDATGARTAGSLAQAVESARGDWLFVVPPELRMRDGWVERLGDHLRNGCGEARLVGMKPGLFRSAPSAVVISRAKAAGSAQAGLQGLARKLGRDAPRLG